MATSHSAALSPDRPLIGALSGFLATAPMSVWMLLGKRCLSWQSQEALPPAKITRELLRTAEVDDDLPSRHQAALVVANHFAYGAAMGALYAPLHRPASLASAAAAGATFGLVVWTGSYCGLLPALGLYQPPQKDTVERTALMISAHLIWGSATGLLVHWLNPSARPSQPFTRQSAPPHPPAMQSALRPLGAPSTPHPVSPGVLS